jgi:hypothetical protein
MEDKIDEIMNNFNYKNDVKIKVKIKDNFFNNIIKIMVNNKLIDKNNITDKKIMIIRNNINNYMSNEVIDNNEIFCVLYEKLLTFLIDDLSS